MSLILVNTNNRRIKLIQSFRAANKMVKLRVCHGLCVTMESQRTNLNAETVAANIYVYPREQLHTSMNDD